MAGDLIKNLFFIASDSVLLILSRELEICSRRFYVSRVQEMLQDKRGLMWGSLWIASWHLLPVFEAFISLFWNEKVCLFKIAMISFA